MTKEQLRAYAQELKERMEDNSLTSKQRWELLQEYQRVRRSLSAF